MYLSDCLSVCIPIRQLLVYFIPPNYLFPPTNASLKSLCLYSNFLCLRANSAAKKRTSHTSHPLASSISLPNVLSTIDETLKAESPRRSESVCSERQDYGHLSIATITATPPLSMLLDHGDDMRGGGDVIREGRFSDVEELTPLGTQRSSISESNSTEMDMNQSTGNVDDRNFLLEEIEKKDNMLAMLTEGLREVAIFLTLCLLL